MRTKKHAHMLAQLPDELWTLILHYLDTTALAWHRIVARGVSRAFRDALRRFPIDTPAVLHYPGLCVHAASSLSMLLKLDIPAVPRHASLRCAVHRKCALCGRRFAGKFTHFSPGLAVYAHPACLQQQCVSAYWVEHPNTPGAQERLGVALHAACVRTSTLLASATLPRWVCFGYRRGIGTYRYSLVAVTPTPGVIPREATVSHHVA